VGRTWRIGEVAERTGLTRRTLRHYDELGLLVPAGRSTGDYRLYDEADLLRLLQIQNLKALGLGLPEIAEALADPELDATSTLRSHLGQLEASLAAQQRLMDRLRSLAGQADRSWEDILGAIAMTQALAHPDPMRRIRAALDPGAASTSELMRALRDEGDPAVREVLMWSLAQRPDAAEAGLAGLDDPDPDIRSLMVRLLAKVRAPVSAALVVLLSDPDPRVVGSVVQAVGQLGDPVAVVPLTALLGDARLRAADLVEALAGFGTAAVDALARAVQAPSVPARLAAVEALGRIGSESPGQDERVAHLLGPLVDDPDEGVRTASVLALDEVGPAGRPGLEQALHVHSLAPLVRRLLDLHGT
jgi:DNA-binding transcriptional MerR regulator